MDIIIAEDDDGHAGLIKKNLERAGLRNKIIRFENGQEVLDFLFSKEQEEVQEKHSYLLLLDIWMPKVDGLEVLSRIRSHPTMHKLPVIVLTTTEDPKEIQKCYALGCNNYIKKPVGYNDFIIAIKQLGLFLTIVEVPVINT